MTLITNLGILAAALLCAIAANHESQCRGRPMAALLFRVAAVLFLLRWSPVSPAKIVICSPPPPAHPSRERRRELRFAQPNIASVAG